MLTKENKVNINETFGEKKKKRRTTKKAIYKI
jgi:hypothetical protein